LATFSPTLADGLLTSVDNYELDPADTFTLLANTFDPSAFSGFTPDGDFIPDNAIGDLAVATDYTLYATGLGSLDLDLGVLLGVIDLYPI
jgi:hypothetical protein